MGKTRDLFKKIRDTKGTFHEKVGTIKDRNSMDLTEAIPKEKKCKKAKWLSEEVLQIAEKKREAKGKGEKESYIHLNAEFQRIAKRDMIAFLSDQCKEIGENHRMRKTRDLFKKIRDTKGTFHAKMDTIKDRKKQKIKKRWEEFTEELYKEDLDDPDNHSGVLTQSQISQSLKSSGP